MPIFDQINLPSPTQEKPRGTRMGVTLAKVTNIKDPENLGRVKCAFLTANKDALELDWAYVMTPFGGNNYGLFCMPNVNDIVLVAFEDGDKRRPFIIGSIWGNIVTPHVQIKDGKNNIYQLKTPNQTIIELNDEKDKGALSVKTPKGIEINLSDEKKTVEVKDGSNTITLDGNGGEVTIKCKNKLTIEVGSASISIDGSTGAIKIKGNQSVSIEGSQVNINANTNATLKGNTQVSIESSGMTNVKGSMLKLN